MTRLAANPIAGEIYKWTHQRFKKGSYVLFLNMLASPLNTVEMGPEDSRYCGMSTIIDINIVVDLLREGRTLTICVITPFVNQRNCFLQAKTAMGTATGKDKIPNVENFSLLTNDASQGKEFDDVILDLVSQKTSLVS